MFHPIRFLFAHLSMPRGIVRQRSKNRTNNERDKTMNQSIMNTLRGKFSNQPVKYPQYAEDAINRLLIEREINTGSIHL